MPNWHNRSYRARVNAEWLKSAAARRILVHWADPRPAWLWSGDGKTLVWRNAAAHLFGGKIKKSGLKLMGELEPLKGQMARLIRLGSPGRSSLSRIQFLAGGRPVSTTATVTPLALSDGKLGALIVGVDPIDPELLNAADGADSLTVALFPQGAEYLAIAPEGHVTGGSPAALELYAATIESHGLPDAEQTTMEIAEAAVTLTRLKASPQGDQLLLIEGEATDIDDIRAEEGIVPETPADVPPDALEEPLLPMGLTPIETPAETSDPVSDDEPWIAEPLTSSGEKLSSLFDRLAEQDSLYGELTADDEQFIAPPERITDFTPVAEFDDPAGDETPITAVDDTSDTDGAMEAPRADEPPELAAEAEDVGPVVVQAVEEVEEEAVVEIDAPLEDQPPAPAEVGVRTARRVPNLTSSRRSSSFTMTSRRIIQTGDAPDHRPRVHTTSRRSTCTRGNRGSCRGRTAGRY